MDWNPYEPPREEPVPPREPSTLGALLVVVFIGLAVLVAILLAGAMIDQ